MIFSVLTFSLMIALLVSCYSSRVSPNVTTIFLKQSVSLDDFAKFQTLFSQEMRSSATKELFEKVKGINSASAELKSYTVITLDNGEMLLVNLTLNEEQAVQSITVIP